MVDALDQHAAQMLRVTPFRDMRIRPGCPYLIKNVIPGGSFVLVYGVSGSGKTFFIGYAALCIATGRDFLGNKVKPGLVVYVAPENPQSVEHRFVASAAELGVDEAQLVMVAGNLDMINGAALHTLLKSLRAIEAEHGPIATVVVDTVSQAMPGADENGSDGMTAFVAACQRIRLEFDCSIVAVHHAGKNVELGARGHSSLRAAVDVEIRINGTEGTRTAELTKVRDGPLGLQIPFALRVIPLGKGVDEDGDPLTTCIVESTVAPAASERRPRPTAANQRLVFQALERCASSIGRAPPGKPMSRIRAVSITTLREECAVDELSHVDTKQRSTRFSEAITGLKAGNYIGWQDDLVWIPAPNPSPEPRPSKEGSGSGRKFGAPESPRSGQFGAFGAMGGDGGNE